MRLLTGSTITAACLLASATSTVTASVTFYDLFYNSYYRQSASSGTPAIINHVFASRVFADPGDIGAASVTVPLAGGLPMADIGGGVWLYSSTTYTDVADMLADFPQGQYDFAISGGALGAAAGSLSRPETLSEPDAIPQVDPESFDFLQALPNASQDITVGINTFGAPAPANVAVTFFIVFEVATGVQTYSTFDTNSTSAFTIPAGTLAGSTDYVLNVYYSSRIQLQGAGFGGAQSIVARDLVTSVYFSTGPSACNPADICGVGATYDHGAVDIGPDGALTIEDFLNFLSAFGDATGCPGITPGVGPCNPADICGVGATYDNGAVDIGPDGELTIEDFLNFLSAFGDATGCP